jgi:hypothetical protein
MATRSSTKFTQQLYTSFAGLNTSRSDISMERAEAQPFVEMDNMYCSAKGYLTNESPLSRFGTDNTYIGSLKFINSSGGSILYSARTSGKTSLRVTNSSVAKEAVWPRNAVVSTALFNGKVIVAGGQDDMFSFDGFEFKTITSETTKGGRYVAQIQDRLAVAGFDADPNEITLSMVNNESAYYNENDPADASVFKPARFNVQNLIGNGDRVRGIATFENNKFAVFTNDRVLIYVADQDFANWALDTRLVVQTGTISHNSIVPVGDEVFFCSRSGVHSLRRSALNGATVYTTPLSDDIQELYQTMLNQVPDKARVNAHFNPDDGRLHIFFPINDLVAYHLVGTLDPKKREGDPSSMRWSTSTFAGLTCGDHLAGVQVCGSISGMHSVGQWYSNDGARGNGYATTPILWHKDLFNPKQGMSLVIYASGAGTIYVDATDETDRKLATLEFMLPDGDQADFTGVPLQRQFTRPFSHEYLGVRLKIRVESNKMIRIFGIGILTQEP